MLCFYPFGHLPLSNPFLILSFFLFLAKLYTTSKEAKQNNKQKLVKKLKIYLRKPKALRAKCQTLNPSPPLTGPTLPTTYLPITRSLPHRVRRLSALAGYSAISQKITFPTPSRTGRHGHVPKFWLMQYM